MERTQGGKWVSGRPADCDSSLTSSFPVSFPSCPLWRHVSVDQGFGEPRRSIHATLRTPPPRITSYGFFIQRRLFCIPRAFATLFSWSFIARYTPRHEYLIDSPAPSRYVPLVFALLFIDYIKRPLLRVFPSRGSPPFYLVLTLFFFFLSFFFLRKKLVTFAIRCRRSDASLETAWNGGTSSDRVSLCQKSRVEALSLSLSLEEERRFVELEQVGEGSKGGNFLFTRAIR